MALADGGIVPNTWCFGWMETSAPAKAAPKATTPSASSVARQQPAPQPINITLNLEGLEITKMPTRMTTKRVERDKMGRIISMIDVEEDVQA